MIDLVVDFSKWPLHSFQVDVPCVIKKITGGGGDDIAYIYFMSFSDKSQMCYLYKYSISFHKYNFPIVEIK